MATFDTVGIDEAIKQFDLKSEEMQRLAPEAVMAGARVAAGVLADTAPYRTGQLSGSITIKGPYHNVVDGHYADVFPDGKRNDGERNATVGYVLEYGRSNMPARPWMRPATESHADEINGAIADVLTGGDT